MIFIANAEGTITSIVNEPVYQSSNKASRIILLAPISSQASVTVSFRLPNGIKTAESLTEPNMTPFDLKEELWSKNGDIKYNCWTYLLPFAVTEYAGKVECQFFAYLQSQNTIISTYKTNITVNKGTAPILPPTPEPDVYQQILEALAGLHGEIVNINNDITNLENNKQDKLSGSDHIEIKDNVVYAKDVATLENGKIPSSQLPSYVDDVIEGSLTNETTFTATDGTIYTAGTPDIGGKLYIDISNNKTYRWSGTRFSQVSESLSLGETPDTAYAGDKGKKNRDDINRLINDLKDVTFSTEPKPNANNLKSITADDISWNIAPNSVSYDKQSPTPELQAQARENIDAVSQADHNALKEKVDALYGGLTESHTDSEMTYQKNILPNALPFGLLDSFGGMSYKSKNLIPFPYSEISSGAGETTINNVIFKVNSDGSILVNSADGKPASESSNFWLKRSDTITLNGHYVLTSVPNGGNYTYYTRVMAEDYSLSFDSFGFKTFKADNFKVKFILIQIAKGYTANNLVFKPMLVKGEYTADMMPPFEKHFDGLRDAKVTEIVSRSANLLNFKDFANEIISISPECEVVNFEGRKCLKIVKADSATSFKFPDCFKVRYFSLKAKGGVGYAPSSFSFDLENGSSRYMAIDSPEWVTKELDITDNKTYITQINCYSLNNQNQELYIDFNSVIASEKKLPYTPYAEHHYPVPEQIQNMEGYGKGFVASDGKVYSNIIDLANQMKNYPVKEKIFNDTDNWIATSYTNTYIYTSNCIDAFIAEYERFKISGSPSEIPNKSYSVSGSNIFIHDDDYSDLNSFKTHMNGKKMLCALKTPDTGPLPVEFSGEITTYAGGSIAFENEHKKPVPNTITYEVFKK